MPGCAPWRHSCGDALHAKRALDASRLAELDALARLRAQPAALRAEADYVELFDRGRRTALHLFEHVHGDSRDRGQAMIDLAQTYERAGLCLRRANCPTTCRGAGVRQHAAAGMPRASSCARPRTSCAPSSARCSSAAARMPACWRRCSTWPANAPSRSACPEPALDETWAEPEAFGGCSTPARHARTSRSRSTSSALPERRSARPPEETAHDPLNNFLFVVYPYICLAVFFMGSLARFDRDQYTWKSDSSQMLRAKQLRWGSNLFHIGILFLLFGHTVGLLTPHWVYEPSSARRQAAVGHRGRRYRRDDVLHRPDDAAAPPHVRPAHPPDQPPHRPRDPDHPVGAAAARPDHAAGVLRHREGRAAMLIAGGLPAGHRHLPPRRQSADRHRLAFKVHMVLGMTIFLLFPFSRLVHVWSGLASIAYLFRPYQIVRSRRLNVPAGRTCRASARERATSLPRRRRPAAVNGVALRTPTKR
jgi:nitrate reductase gamma subunit